MTFNFGIQLLTDLVSVVFVDKIGYQASMILAHALTASGLLSLTILPEVLPVPFPGIFNFRDNLCCRRRIIGSSRQPGCRACPSDNKEKSKYATLILLLGTGRGCAYFNLFFFVAGIETGKFSQLSGRFFQFAMP